MIKYSNILSLKKNNEDKLYKCNICQLCKRGEIWMKYHININQTTDNKETINICSYLCSKSYFKNKIFKLDRVINREDFNYLRPILNKKKYNFKILSLNEIEKLSDNEYNKYIKDLDNYFILNPERAKIQLDIQNEIDSIEDIY